VGASIITAEIRARCIGLRLPFCRRNYQWSGRAVRARNHIADVEKYTHFDAQLPFDAAEGFVTLVHLAGKMGNLLM
jgi:hypothetical protein